MADYRALAAQDARKYSLPVPVFLAQIGQESGFNPNARSSAGAEGIAQIVPKYHPGVDPMNPVAALDYAAKYDKQLIDKYGGNVAQALSVYNSGRPDAYKDPNFAGGQTYRYVKDILGNTAPTGGGTTALPAPAAHPAAVAPMTPVGGPSPFIQSLLQATSKILGTAAPVLPITRATIGPTPAAPTMPTTDAAATTMQPGKLALPIRGTIGTENPKFLANLTAAAKARGAVAIVATSGERTGTHNAQVGGVTHSNHLPDAQGEAHALDGYAILRDGSRVPLGQFLKPNAATYGLRSGDVAGFFNGNPDTVHVDDGFNGGQ